MRGVKSRICLKKSHRVRAIAGLAAPRVGLPLDRAGVSRRTTSLSFRQRSSFGGNARRASESEPTVAL